MKTIGRERRSGRSRRFPRPLWAGARGRGRARQRAQESVPSSIRRPLKCVYLLQDFLEDVGAALLVGTLLRDREVMFDLRGFPKSVVAIVLYELAFPTPELLGHLLMAQQR